jgi:hypothetical protein
MNNLFEHELKNISTTEEEKLRRLTFCNSCENKKKYNQQDICVKCACPIDFITQFEFKTCPIGLWQ